MSINSQPLQNVKASSPRECFRRSGFALIAALGIMGFLVLLAVGLFTLASVSLSVSGQAQAQVKAEANAKMALMVAMGELQKNVGPDRVITATSEIRATESSPPSKPNLTGVWSSWSDFVPSAAANYDQEKINRFRGWLVSSENPDDLQSPDFVDVPWTGEVIELVGDDTLGLVADESEKVRAGRVPISDDGAKGSYAWHVSDESVKARVNLYRDPSQNTTLAEKRALTKGHRPDASILKDSGGNLLSFLPNDATLPDFTNAEATMGKVTGLEQTELLSGAENKIRPLRHDITPYSLGVMTNVRDGGLKQDLSSVFEMGDATNNTLPAEFTNEKVYDSTLGFTGVSDPNWSALAGYYNSFRNLTDPETNPTYALQSGAASLDPVPEGFNPAPVIAKVDTIFSLLGRPLTDIYWLRTNPNWDICANLIITPVVTLHNPYNVSISFQKMQVSFTNIPVAFNYMLQDGGGGFASQSIVPGTFESLNTMNYKQYRGDKTFGITIANWSDDNPHANPNDPWSSPVDGPVILKPGQTLVCAPTLPPNASFRSDSGSGGNAVGFDWQNDLTPYIKAKPEFTPGLGFELTGVNIGNMRRDVGKGSWCWFLMLRDQATNPKVSQSTVTDQFYVEFKLQQPSWYLDDSTLLTNEEPPTFEINAKIQTTESDTPVEFAKLQFDYQDTATLEDAIDDRVYRYPPSGSLRATDIVAPGDTKYNSQYTYVQPFAIFSAYTRTTRGGVYETGLRTESSGNMNILRDGRLAGKPMLFHNPSRTNFTLDLSNEKLGVQPYELNLQPFLSKGDYEDYFDVDAVNRVPSLSGNRTATGIKSGSYLEIPSGPLQTIADFRRSNAFSSTYLPHFVQPVGNSLLHPLMSANVVVETDGGISDDELLDHSVLANHAFYDRFYFSTFATRGNTSPGLVFEEFMNGQTPLASQAFQPYLPEGQTVAGAKDELFTSGGKPKDGAYRSAAEYQMVQGPFNVNSTSIPAWKAVLASVNNTEIPTLWARNAELEANMTNGTPITPMSLVNGGAVDSAGLDSTQIDNSRTNNWNGYRELTEPELENLAAKIVEEIRERGPFLSMSEFVNRRIGPAGPLTIRGALEAAIAKAEVNEPLDADSSVSFLGQVPITTDDIDDTDIYAYKTPEASAGNPAAGAPGWVSQGDLLRILEPGATLRGDTFVIRVYGDAQNSSGAVMARAYAEAVVQRVPEYLNPIDRPSVNAAVDPGAQLVNEKFGRRLEVVSFRWLSSNEI